MASHWDSLPLAKVVVYGVDLVDLEGWPETCLCLNVDVAAGQSQRVVITQRSARYLLEQLQEKLAELDDEGEGGEE